MTVAKWRFVTRFSSSLGFVLKPFLLRKSSLPPTSLCLYIVLIMSGRISKSSRPVASSMCSCLALALLIEFISFKVISCSFCSLRHLKCRIIKRTLKCAKCTHCGQACNASGVSVAVAGWGLLPLARRLRPQARFIERRLREQFGLEKS
jgi:hypothetical protein